MENDQSKDNLVRSLESLLEGRANVSERNSLVERLSKDKMAWKDYVTQVRIHLMLEEYFLLEKVVCRSGFKWLKRAASVVLVVGMVTLVFLSFRDTESHLHVVASTMPMLTADECEMLKARYFVECAGSGAFAGQLVKYEPGTIENPGAAIEVLKTSAKEMAGHHLNEGDRVWRQNIVLPEGQMSFKIGGRGVVTIIGPSAVKLHDDKTVEVQSGCVYVETQQSVSLVLAKRRLTIDNASVGVVAQGDGESCDLVVTDGIVLMGEGHCLRTQDGVRITTGGELKAFHSFGNAQILQSRFLTGVSDIKIKEGHNYVF